MSWFRVDTKHWSAVRDTIAGTTEWTRELAIVDLRYLQDAALGPDGDFPSRSKLAAAWGWNKARVSRLLQDVDAWSDPAKRSAWDAWYAENKASAPAAGAAEPTATHPRTDREPIANRSRTDTPSFQADNQPSPTQQRTDSEPTANRQRTDGDHTRDRSTLHTHPPPSTEGNSSDPQAARADTRPPLVLLAAVPEADEPKAEPAPPWAGKVATAAKSGGRKVKPAEVAAAFVEALSALRGAPVNPARCATDATPLAALWKAEGFPPLAEFVAEAVLVGKAARESKNPLFARDIRAEGWAEGVDRSRSVATLTVQARWQDRVRAARAEFGGGPAGAALPTANPAPTATPLGAEPPRPVPSPAQQAAAAWAYVLGLDGFQRPNRTKPPSPGGVRAWWLAPEGDEPEHVRRAAALRSAGGYVSWCNFVNDFERRDFRLRFLAAYQQVNR